MKCPDCGSTMDAFYSEREYDCDGYWCDECKRVWCDDELHTSVLDEDPYSTPDDHAEIRNHIRNTFSEAMRKH